MFGKAAGGPSHEAWISYAKSCVQPGLEYFQCQLASNSGLKASLEIFRGCCLFLSQRVHIMQPNASAIDQELNTIPFLNSQQQLDGLKSELPAYLTRAADTDQQFDILEWWKRNASELPNWSAAAKKILLIQPSSATSESVFIAKKLFWSATGQCPPGLC